MSGLGRAWVRTNVRKAKELLVELQDLTKEEKDYLESIVRNGGAFLRQTGGDNTDEVIAENMPSQHESQGQTNGKTRTNRRLAEQT